MLSVIYGLFLGVWRRIFGGCAENIPVLKIRAVQHAIGFLGACIALWCCDYAWWQIIACAGVLQGLFWARGHGEFFDYGHSKNPDVSRYEKEWWWKYAKKYIPEKMLYGYSCDFLCMNIRYTMPAVLMGLILVNIPLMFAGLVVAGVYSFMWTMHDLDLTPYPTKIAEFISGFLVGILLTL